MVEKIDVDDHIEHTIIWVVHILGRKRAYDNPVEDATLDSSSCLVFEVLAVCPYIEIERMQSLREDAIDVIEQW